MKEKEFKERHGGYNPYELEIHKRGFNLGFISAIWMLVGICLLIVIMEL